MTAVQHRTVEIIPGLTVGQGQPLTIIAGPCQIESLDHCLMIAEHVKDLERLFPVRVIFKSSFDKANRTSLSGKRGPGIDEGLKVLAEVKRRTGLPVLTDVHSPEQIEAARSVIDVLQIPAFLCRQTDLLLAAGASGRAIHVKKGQFLHPDDMRFVAEKIASQGNQKILLCERGATFGYRDLVVDMRSLVIMRNTGYPVIFDATHSVQSLGGSGGSSGGQREYIAPLVRAAVAVGVDGLFLECHDAPERAPSDGPSMLPLPALQQVVARACAIRAVA